MKYLKQLQNTSIQINSSSHNFLMFVLEFYKIVKYSSKLPWTVYYFILFSACGGHLSGEDGSIFSPNYPQNFNRNETCEWLIDIDDGDSIELTFVEVDLYVTENCSESYVKVSQTSKN